MVTEGIGLGQRISGRGIEIDHTRIEAIKFAISQSYKRYKKFPWSHMIS
jgi:hypothetical protein